MTEISKETALFGLVHGGMSFVEDLKKELAEWEGYSWPLNNERDAKRWRDSIAMLGIERFWEQRLSSYQRNIKHDRKFIII